jgi:hypothetical protein
MRGNVFVFANFRYHIQKCMKNRKSVAVEVEEVVIQNQNPPSSANLNLLIDHDTDISDHSPDVSYKKIRTAIFLFCATYLYFGKVFGFRP